MGPVYTAVYVYSGAWFFAVDAEMFRFFGGWDFRKFAGALIDIDPALVTLIFGSNEGTANIAVEEAVGCSKEFGKAVVTVFQDGSWHLDTYPSTYAFCSLSIRLATSNSSKTAISVSSELYSPWRDSVVKSNSSSSPSSSQF